MVSIWLIFLKSGANCDVCQCFFFKYWLWKIHWQHRHSHEQTQKEYSRINCFVITLRSKFDTFRELSETLTPNDEY